MVIYTANARGEVTRFFGRLLTDDELFRLAGALPGATVTVSVRQQHGWLYLKVDDWRFERYETSIRRDRDGSLFAYLHHVYVAGGQRGQGHGARAFLRQMTMAQQLGLKRFELFAAGGHGSTDENGYYVWARYGFDAPLYEVERRALPPELFGVTMLN
jgi:hypothetical protein